ncbi:MAG: hypothetical protein AAB590_03610 [Patescibacteria group bacterium]
MRDKLIGQINKESGISTLEMLIALALITISISAVILVVFGNQSVSADIVTNNEALIKSQAIIEDARAQSLLDYSSVVTTSPVVDGVYTKQTVIDQASVTQCGKDVYSTVSWKGDGNRNLHMQFKTHLTDFVTAFAVGHCSGTPPPSGWNPPATFASSNFNPGKPTGLDILNRIVYMTSDHSPYLHIADTRTATLGQSSGLFVTFANSFDDGTQLNDIKVTRLSDGKIYAMVARDTSTDQFEIIDVDDFLNPVSVAKLSLAGVAGASPEGWRLFYYSNKVYVVARFTAGPELHIFDVSTPTSPVEIGSGTDLGRTVESLAVTKKNISGTDHYFIFTAADKNSAEVSVFDIVYPTAATYTFNEITAPDQNLPGNQDGATAHYLNGYLYFGRNSAPGGSDFYIFDAHSPQGGLTIKQEQNINTSVLGVVVAGPYSFLATSKANEEFQVWTSDPDQTLTKVNTVSFNFPNLVNNGVVYEYPYIYVISQGNDALRILYTP